MAFESIKSKYVTREVVFMYIIVYFVSLLYSILSDDDYHRVVETSGVDILKHLFCGPPKSFIPNYYDKAHKFKSISPKLMVACLYRSVNLTTVTKPFVANN